MSVLETLIRTLRARPHLPAGELLTALNVSRATLMRMVRAAGADVLTIGRARRTSYAARRPLRGSAAPLPVFQIDEHGGSTDFGRMDLAYPHGTVFEFGGPTDWPIDDSMRDGWFDGLPYFVQDMRPEGFLGRQFARTYAPILQLSEDPRLWSDDDALYALSLLGADQSGNLIVGDAACRSWLDKIEEQSECLEESQVLDAYLERALRAMQDGVVGSSAAGEFPKFTALRMLNGVPTHVIVKFSGSDDSVGTRRWSDLLICEHIAAQNISSLPGLASAQTRVLQAGNRTFFETVRFDRHGPRGRSPLCSWAAFNYGWFGLAGRPWTEGAVKLLLHGIIDRDTATAITRLWHFGQLVGNTDMHDGNLSFRPRRTEKGPGLRLAPVYDMLPMLYAPRRGVEVAPVTFVPRLPLPAEREAWQQAADAAARFWSQAAADDRISEPFRAICADNANKVHRVMKLQAAG